MKKPQRQTLPFRLGRAFPPAVIRNACCALQAVVTAPAGAPPRRAGWYLERCHCPGGWFEVIRVDFKHRLVRTKRRPGWVLLNHAEYDKLRT
ncbi:hypothetical protein [Klebsiella quasivariicola]|uniref:hypothetical protein n=1 Tax=Klebsiella quasivariicola TaxID=2026240 RepID=UPI0024785601|nr:hypothetical protein [Klebsiella quasivariicola]